MTDAELLRQAQSGDLDAWRSLYARCLPAVWRQAAALTGDHTVAEEVVSETFLALVRGIRQLDAGKVQLHAWLRGVVRHKVADHGRHASREHRLLTAVREEGSQEAASVAVSAALETEETKQRVLETLDQLPELHRLVLEWKHVEGFSVRQIAERTGQTEKAAESALYRARREFRRVYARLCSDETLNSSGFDPDPGALEESL